MTGLVENERKLIARGRAADAIALLREEAQRGNSEACIRLGLHYYSDKHVAGDLESAWGWFEKAHAGGHAKAGYFIGRICNAYAERGVRMPSQSDMSADDLSAYWNDCAVAWYRRSAGRGYHAALARLGYCHYRGLGVPRSADKAFDYFLRARAAGNVGAAAAIVRMLWCGHRGLRGFPQGFIEFARSLHLTLRIVVRGRAPTMEEADERFYI